MKRLLLFLLCLMLVRPDFCLSAQAASRSSVEAVGAPYDAELYELAYKVFMFNANSADAYRLAEAAILSRPKDRQWRRRAIQAAEWSGQPEKALRHLVYLARSTGDRTALRKALELSEGLGDLETRRDLLLVDLRRGGGNDALLRQLLEVNELRGAPEDSVSLLKPFVNGSDRKFALSKLPELYQSIGRPLEAIDAINEYAASFAMTTELLLLRSRIMYGRRDFEGGWKGLKEGMEKARPHDSEYWQALSDICWYFQDVPCVAAASETLTGSGVGREEDYYRLTYALSPTDPGRAYDVALTGWRRFMKPAFFTALLEMGLELGRYYELRAIIDSLGYEEANALVAIPYAWRLRSEVYRRAGMPERSIDCYRYSLAIEPENIESAGGFIWLLIDLRNDTALRRAVESLEIRHRGRRELYDALGAGYAYLGEYRKGLRYYRLNYEGRKGDPLWLAAYADLLEQAQMPQAAVGERLRAFRLVRKGMAAVGEYKGEVALETLRARLLMSLRPGDAADAAVRNIIRSSSGDASGELMTAWALSSERNDLARLLLWRMFGRTAGGPDWSRFSLALEETDAPALSDMLTRNMNRLPYRDAVEGAQRIGASPLAADHAFHWLERSPDDDRLDLQFRDLVQDHHEEAIVGGRYQEFGSVSASSGYVRVSRHLSDRYSLSVGAKNVVYTRLNDTAVGSLPRRDLSGDMAISAMTGAGKLSVAVGGRSSLNDFSYVSFSSDYRLSSAASLYFSAELSGMPEETAMLQIAGVRDRLSLAVTGNITRRDMVSLRSQVYSLRDQWRRPLASGESTEAEIAHRVTFAYPDMLLRLFGGYYRYGIDGVPEGETASLIPPGFQRDARFFIPRSFVQCGVGISIGNSARERYSRTWQPYGSLDLIWNSEAEYGFRYDLGLAGPVMGVDRLDFGIAQDSGRFGGSDLNTSVGVTYRYYFN